MSCPKWENDLALYVGGDLPAGRIKLVESHLGDCVECRVLLEDLRAGRALLDDLTDQPLEAALAAQVRQRVLERLRAPAPAAARFGYFGHYWKWALAALVLAAALLYPWHARQVAPIARFHPAARGESAPPSPPALIPAHHQIRRRRYRAPAAAPHNSAPLLVKFQTGDPDIVIYWLVDQHPQGD